MRGTQSTVNDEARNSLLEAFDSASSHLDSCLTSDAQSTKESPSPHALFEDCRSQNKIFGAATSEYQQCQTQAKRNVKHLKPQVVEKAASASQIPQCPDERLSVMFATQHEVRNVLPLAWQGSKSSISWNDHDLSSPRWFPCYLDRSASNATHSTLFKASSWSLENQNDGTRTEPGKVSNLDAGRDCEFRQTADCKQSTCQSGQSDSPVRDLEHDTPTGSETNSIMDTANRNDILTPGVGGFDVSQNPLRKADSMKVFGRLSAAVKLPNEIIQQLYLYMSPKDFNSARHTCRVWMHASLEQHILCSMLQRGGWWSFFELLKQQDFEAPKIGTLSAGRIWFLSCILSRECALAGRQRCTRCLHIHHETLECCSDERLGYRTLSCCACWPAVTDTRVFRQVARVYFTDLSAGYTPSEGRSGLIFAGSSCGHYLSVADGGMIYIYQVSGDNLRALTSVICPRRVLAMSMDPSQGYFAVAALLEGRMGFMCTFRVAARPDPGPVVSEPSSRRCPSVDKEDGSRSLHSRGPIEPYEVRSGDEIAVVEDDFTESGREGSQINLAWNSHTLRTDLSISTRDQWSAENVEIEHGRRTVYHELCTEDDPPRSIAICPQRQCVAFGCSAGLELHWFDALMRQDLHRWFPLTGSSDFLYFLPPRRGVDSPRKMRLISSAAHPSQRPSFDRKLASSDLRAGWGLTGLLWGSRGSGDRVQGAAGAVDDCDHYCAVPTGDGFHILFTDPATGMLCLGSDAPIGSPRRLVRKIMFVPPCRGRVPRIYASSFDKSRGARISAAYDDQIFLYSVPPDVLKFSLKEQLPGGVTPTDMNAAYTWMTWWPKKDIPANHPTASSMTAASNESSTSVWPLFVSGTYVGDQRYLVDLFINTTLGSISIWALCSQGEATVWKVDRGDIRRFIIERTISRDGQVMDPYEVDADNDVVMEDSAIVSCNVGMPLISALTRQSNVRHSQYN